jgi:iron(III) transport system substrate-binding protein
MCMRHMFRQKAILVLAVMATLGVGVALPATLAATAEVVVVYTARHYGQEPVFEAFTKQTGIEIQSFDGSPSELFERLRAEGDKTPADVLISVDAGDLWNATQAGLLAKIDSPELQANIPAHLRDAENRWFAITVRARTIMYNTRKVKPEELSTYEALGDPKWKNRLCLRSSNHIYNQSLLATMIKRFGEAKVEAIVRGWVANNPTLISSDTRILESIAAGECDIGLTNSYYLGRLLAKDPNFPVAPFWANQQSTGTHVNISGAGVTAHAKHRANAIKLIEFLSRPEAQQGLANNNFEYPANPQAPVHPILAKWGPFKQDDIDVAAASEFQVAAVKLADRVGYK